MDSISWTPTSMAVYYAHTSSNSSIKVLTEDSQQIAVNGSSITTDDFVCYAAPTSGYIKANQSGKYLKVYTSAPYYIESAHTYEIQNYDVGDTIFSYSSGAIAYCVVMKVWFTRTETTLWTNSSPTSSFSDETVTISDDLNNYNYLKVEYRLSTANSTTSNAIISIEQLINNGTFYDTGGKFAMCSRIDTPYARLMAYASSTTLKFGLAYKLYSTEITNSYVIPTNIYGIKWWLYYS